MQSRKKKSLGINAALNVIQQLCSVLFPLITIPYISRVLETESYGKVNFTSSIISYFILFAQLGVSTYGIREVANVRENKVECNRIISEIFTITLFSTLISYALLGISVLAIPKFQGYWVLLAVQSISILFYTIGAEWINKGFEDFAFLTLRYIIAQVLSIVLMFLFVKTRDEYVKYAILTVAAQAGAYTLNFFYIRKYVSIKLTTHLNLKAHLQPLIILFFNGLATTIYVNSDLTILGLLQNDSAVGIYNISAKVYITVKHVINAIVLVSIPRLSQMRDTDNISEYNALVNKIFCIIIIIVFPAMIALIMLANPIIHIFAGISYIDGTLALQILGLALIFAVFGCFLTNCILIPYKNDKIILIASSISALVNIVLNIAIIPKLSYTGAAITTLIAEIIMVIICYFATRKIIKMEISRNDVLTTKASCVCVFIVCLLSNHFIENIFARLVSSILLSVASYLTVLIITKNGLLGYVRTIIKR